MGRHGVPFFIPVVSYAAQTSHRRSALLFGNVEDAIKTRDSDHVRDVRWNEAQVEHLAFLASKCHAGNDRSKPCAVHLADVVQVERDVSGRSE